MGYAIAEELAQHGAEVVLVSGPVSVKTSNKLIQVVSVESADEMYQASASHFMQCDGAVLSAAVADYTPANPATGKTKSGCGNMQIELKPTKDIAASLGQMKNHGQILVGFALETGNELENARAKLQKKNLDFIVLNSLSDEGAGFGVDTNKIVIIGNDNKMKSFELKSKREVAADIVGEIILRMK
jgi:phosphopantothenoylcysteine decarboxylase / phosphopantothenate---cysteine ligase